MLIYYYKRLQNTLIEVRYTVFHASFEAIIRRMFSRAECPL